MDNLSYHIPAMLKETLAGLAIKPAGTYVDVTMGGAGHSRAILNELNENGRLISLDQDLEAIERITDNDARWTRVHGNFRYLENYLDYLGINSVDGILADLGVSFHHFDSAKRGFSFRFNSPLDMRMNQSAPLSAKEVVNTYSEADIARVLYLYGECRDAKVLAAKLIRARAQHQIESTGELVSALGYKDIEGHKKDLARIFQALRIEVNDELGALESLLTAARNCLKQGGRLVILTYHSLEDRMVKNFLKSGNIDGTIEKDFWGNISTPFDVLVKGDTACDEEVERNPRARSAKLRVAEKR